MRVVSIVLLGLFLFVEPVLADTVVLKNGTTLEGEILTADKTLDRIEMTVKVGSSSARLTLKYADVVSLTFERGLDDDGPSAGPFTGPKQRTGPRTGPDLRRPVTQGPAPTPKKARKVEPRRVAPAPRKTTPRARRIPGPVTKAPTPLRADGHRILYLVDASGSMAIGKRWEQATQQLQKMIERLPDKMPFDVMLFHDTCVSLFTNNNTLFKTPKSGYRTAKRMRENEPDKRRGTNLYHALVRASHRKPKKIVVITDGILTRGGPFGANHALRKVREWREKGIPVDFLCAQDGTYQAAGIENKPAARQLLARYARAGRGVFLPLPNVSKAREKLPETFNPLPGTADGTAVPWRVEILAPKKVRDFKHWEDQWKVVRGGIPSRFRVRVWDPLVNSGAFLDVWEYGGAVWLDVPVGDGRVLNLRFHRSNDKQTLVSDREIRVVGPGSKHLDNPLHDKRYAYSADVGTLVYRRGTERFPFRGTTSGRKRIDQPPALPPGRTPPALPPEGELAHALAGSR